MVSSFCFSLSCMEPEGGSSATNGSNMELDGHNSETQQPSATANLDIRIIDKTTAQYFARTFNGNLIDEDPFNTKFLVQRYQYDPLNIHATNNFAILFSILQQAIELEKEQLEKQDSQNSISYRPIIEYLSVYIIEEFLMAYKAKFVKQIDFFMKFIWQNSEFILPSAISVAVKNFHESCNRENFAILCTKLIIPGIVLYTPLGEDRSQLANHAFKLVDYLCNARMHDLLKKMMPIFEYENRVLFQQYLSRLMRLELVTGCQLDIVEPPPSEKTKATFDLRFHQEVGVDLCANAKTSRLEFNDTAATELAYIYNQVLSIESDLFEEGSNLIEYIRRFGIDVNNLKSGEKFPFFWEIYKKAVQLNLYPVKTNFFLTHIITQLSKANNQSIMSVLNSEAPNLDIQKQVIIEFLLNNSEKELEFYIEMAMKTINDNNIAMADTICILIIFGFDRVNTTTKNRLLTNAANLIPLMQAKRMFTCLRDFESVFKNSSIYNLWLQATTAGVCRNG